MQVQITVVSQFQCPRVLMGQDKTNEASSRRRPREATTRGDAWPWRDICTQQGQPWACIEEFTAQAQSKARKYCRKKSAAERERGRAADHSSEDL
jgi:hypothetical protein